MKIKTIFKLLAATAVLGASSANAYVVYNNMGYSVHLIDTIGYGIDRSIAKDGHVACAPKSGGCSGHINFQVFLNNGTTRRLNVLCMWNGVIGDEPGNYFVISPSETQKGRTIPACKIEYYHD